MKRGTDRVKQKFPCNKCKQLDHWAVECPQKQQHAGDRGGKSAAKKNADVFPVLAIGPSKASIVNAAGTVTAVQQDTLRLENIILYHTQNLPLLKRSYLARKMC